MSQFWEVLKFSYLERVSSKAFLYTTLVMVLVVTLLMNVPRISKAFSNDEKTEIWVIDKTHHFIKNVDDFGKYVSSDYIWKKVSPEQQAAGVEKLKNQDVVEGILTIEERNGQIKADMVMNRINNPNLLEPLNAYLQALNQSLIMQQINLTPDQLSAMSHQVSFQTKELKANLDKSYMPIYLMIMMLYMTILFFASSLATAVAAEKSSRIMEVLITKVRPIWLLYGKVIGVGLVGLTQYALILLCGVLAYKFSYAGPFELMGLKIDFTTISGKTMAYFVIFYLLGYFFYATLFAAIGSLVSRTEDANQMIMPLSMVLVGAMIVSLYSMQNPEGNMAVISSYIPFLTPMMMFIRIGLSEVPVAEIVAAIAVMVVSIVIGCWVAAKIYRVGVMLYGKRPSVKEVVVAMKTYKV